MSDIAQQAASMQQTLLDIAKQANDLGIGLQNAAPSDKAGVPNPSIEYLTAVAATLTALAGACDPLIQVGESHPRPTSPR